MKYICLDLEMSETNDRKQKKHLRGLKHEIIEIGAVMLDSDFNYLGCVSIPVKPIHTTVTEFITNLTGLTNKSLAEADTLQVAFKKYIAWIGKEDAVTFCWGRNDFSQLWDELYIKSGFEDKYVENLKNFVDLQEIFGNLLGTKSGFSLDAAINTVGCKFLGCRHSALGDAFNTARVLHKISKEEKFNIEQGKIYEKANPIYKNRYELYNLNSSDTVSMKAFFPKELLEKFNSNNIQDSNKIADPTKTEDIICETPADRKIAFYNFAKRFFPKAPCFKYNVPMRNYLNFRAKMFLKHDLKCKDSKIFAESL